MSSLDRFLDVPSIDPEDARRRKLLNILLVGMAIIAILALLVTSGTVILGMVSIQQQGIGLVYWAALAMIGGAAILYLINRYWSGVLASSIFVLLLTAIIALTDEPIEVARGRSLFVLAIPVLMASVLLRPWASFIMAGLVSALIAAIEIFVLAAVPNVPAMLGFLAIALAAWLSARSLEQALADLRAINRNLDRLVEDRTRELAEALGRNQAILEGIADGVIVFDPRGRATVANPAVSSLLACTPAQIMGADIEALMGQQVNIPDQEKVLERLQNPERGQSSIRLDWGRKNLSISFAPVRDNFEQVTGTVAVFRDFTREAEVERMKSAFVSMVSHELRTPLGGIMGYAEMLKEGVYGTLSDKQKEIMERILDNTKEQMSMVNDLLDRARLEAGRLTLDIAPFAPVRLLDDVMSVMSVLAQNKGLKLTSHIDGQVPATLSGDRQRLQQILINLAGNAVKFTDQGEVHIRLYRPDPDHWAMDVADTGPGILQEAQSYIFDPFRQVDGSATRAHGGAGLGLSIVKQLTTLMGGEIKLVSKVGRGSIFTVLLPLVPPQQRKETL
jgi:PAS domain S-box-containing protein